MCYSNCEESAGYDQWEYMHSLWLSEQAAIDRETISRIEDELEFREFMDARERESFGVEYGQANNAVPSTRKLAQKSNRVSSVE